jgi:hypothetical protein
MNLFMNYGEVQNTILNLVCLKLQVGQIHLAVTNPVVLSMPDKLNSSCFFFSLIAFKTLHIVRNKFIISVVILSVYFPLVSEVCYNHYDQLEMISFSNIYCISRQIVQGLIGSHLHTNLVHTANFSYLIYVYTYINA